MDTKIISIEFAASEEVMAQFFSSVIVGVKANPVERSALAKGEVVIPAVAVEEVQSADAGTETSDTGAVVDGNAVIGNTREQAVAVELPVLWQEDGEAVVHFTFEFNDEVIEIHQPEET